MTATHLLARQIAAATGLGLSVECTAMTGGRHPGSSDGPEPDNPAEPSVSLKDELGE